MKMIACWAEERFCESGSSKYILAICLAETIRRWEETAMPILADYHLHSSFSGDSDRPMEEMIERGIAMGMETMCFTEHMDMDYPYGRAEEEGLFELDTESYARGFGRCREKYGGRIRLHFGIELGLQPHLAQELETYVRRYPFEFVIASSHVCNGKDPYYADFYKGRTQEEAYREYFQSILDNLKVFHDFDVYGHLDYVVRYGPGKDRGYSYDRYKDILDKILYRLVEGGKGLEVNTGAIPHGLRELNPCTDIIKRYRNLGGEIVTVGSDAHAPERIGEGFERAADILTSCGYKYYTVFADRRPEFIKL